jgi:cell division protein ZapD
MSITFEYPLNDMLRTCLRIDQLFACLHQELKQPDTWAARHALRYLIEIIQVTDRTDLRTKLSQQVQLHLEALLPLREQQKVDQSMLERLIAELNGHAKVLHDQHGKFGQSLRDSAFLNGLNWRTHQSGGLNDNAHPSYQLWLQQDHAYRKQMLDQWYQDIQPLSKIVKRLLQLVRDHQQSQELDAKEGFYQQTLDPRRDCHLIRITLLSNTNIFPEVSIGRHRLAIRMMSADNMDKPTPHQQNTAFTLSICAPFDGKNS